MNASADELRTKAAGLRAKADELKAAADRSADRAPGGFVTGRSPAQNRASNRALDRTIDNAVAALRLCAKAKELEGQARALDEAPVRARRRELQAEAERQERASVAALPIANDPAAPIRMTRAEWTRVPKDYRGIRVEGGFRRRTALQGGLLGEVFLTDAKVKIGGDA